MDNIKAYANAAPPNDINKFDAILEMCKQVREKTNATKFLVTCNELEFASLKALAPVCTIVKDFTSFSYEMSSKVFKCQLDGNEVIFYNSNLPGTSDLIYVIPLIEEPNYEEESATEETDESTTEDH